MSVVLPSIILSLCDKQVSFKLDSYALPLTIHNDITPEPEPESESEANSNKVEPQGALYPAVRVKNNNKLLFNGR